MKEQKENSSQKLCDKKSNNKIEYENRKWSHERLPLLEDGSKEFSHSSHKSALPKRRDEKKCAKKISITNNPRALT